MVVEVAVASFASSEAVEDGSADAAVVAGGDAGRALIEDLNENLDLGLEVDLSLESEFSSEAIRCCLLGFVERMWMLSHLLVHKAADRKREEFRQLLLQSLLIGVLLC